MTVSGVMTRDVQSILPRRSVRDAARMTRPAMWRA